MGTKLGQSISEEAFFFFAMSSRDILFLLQNLVKTLVHENLNALPKKISPHCIVG